MLPWQPKFDANEPKNFMQPFPLCIDFHPHNKSMLQLELQLLITWKSEVHGEKMPLVVFNVSL